MRGTLTLLVKHRPIDQKVEADNRVFEYHVRDTLKVICGQLAHKLSNMPLGQFLLLPHPQRRDKRFLRN
jgi:hypothetical protein